LHCQDKTGTLTQNIMHVENLAVFDEVYESNMFRSVINNSDMPVASNLSQVAAVGSICNSAVADSSNSEEDRSLNRNKGFVGNATGKHNCLSGLVYWHLQYS
jgi:sodium/potassium-transporting ATPase subunit alpha